MAKKRKVATKRVTRKPARKRSANPDATINTLVILVVIVMVLGGLFLYAQNKKQFALWPSIMEAIANLPAPPLAAVIGDPESTGSVQPSQPATQIEVPRPASSIEAPRQRQLLRRFNRRQLRRHLRPRPASRHLKAPGTAKRPSRMQDLGPLRPPEASKHLSLRRALARLKRREACNRPSDG
jgi:hypothetical protein